MEYELLGWPPAGPTLDLDHERFSYAGKFVRTATGKAVAREDGAVLGAAAFNEDRGASGALRIRTVTVRVDRRGEGIGSRLLRFVVDRATRADGDGSDDGGARPYERVRIAVNNPFAYEAAYRAGFGYTGEERGLAEVLLEAPAPGDASYRDGLGVFERDRSTQAAREFAASRRERGPPRVVTAPTDDA